MKKTKKAHQKADGQIAKTEGIDIWYETFGKKSDPAFLLIMGGLSQGILWPTEFCEKLAKSGFFVIRYDHRDSGFSSCFNFEKSPYNLLDMAKDGVHLLDYLDIEKAHLLGLSMGGPIAELISVHFPKRVLTLTLQATSVDFRPSSLAYDRQYPNDITLSRPKEIYLNWMHTFLKLPPQTDEEVLEQRVLCWSILNGSQSPFEEDLYREIHREFLSRLKHPESLFNHLDAIKNSFELIQKAPQLVKTQTLIFHGSEDPIFPPDHGEALAKAITGSKFVFVQGMGHVPNSYFYDKVIDGIKEHVKNAL
jgi:10-carbomethoxy-13-deoxycarminomycin esterase